MNRRAVPALVMLLAGGAALVAVGSTSPTTAEPVFSAPAGTWMPAVTELDVLTESWFCPALPSTGEEGTGGEVVVANRGEEQLVGRFTVLGPDGPAAEQEVVVPPWSRTTIDADAYLDTPFVSVVVEIDGGGAVVEQRALHPAGESVAPCANDTSREWYFADGFTRAGSTETLVLSNPYDDPVVADLEFATELGATSPAAFQGFPVPPRSVKTIEIADLGARDEPVIAVRLVTSSGRLVLGRAQHYVGGGRLGYDVSLAAPALRDQFWFADGERGEGITETFAIYNPTEAAVDVDVVFLGLPLEANFGDVEPIEVPAGEVVVFDVGELESIPDGRHAVVFSTLSEPAIVVERVLTRPTDDAVATSVVLGAPPRPDGYVASRWHVGIGPSSPAEDALVLYNIDNADGAVTVEAVGPAGPTPVPSLTDVVLPAGAVITLDLTSDEVIGQELIVTATNRVFVERLLPRDGDLDGRSGSWALPANDS